MPTAQRIGSALVALLLIGSLAVPITAQPATADSSTSCPEVVKAALPSQCIVGEAVATTVDTSQSDTAVQTDLHVLAVGEWESQQRYLTLTNNYLEDTKTIASIDSKHAVATAWENGNTSTEASTKAREAIRDYYAQKQIQLLNSWEKQYAQMDYTWNVSDNSNKVPQQFVSIHHTLYHSEENGNIGNTKRVGTTMVTREVSLVNGSTQNITVPKITIDYEYTATGDHYTATFVIEPFETWSYDPSREWEFYGGKDYNSYLRDIQLRTSGMHAVMNVGDTLEGQRVGDLREWRESWDEIKNQSATISSNYDSAFTDDLYTALDNGEITPSELRTAEGQVRWLSGDDSVTGERFRQATLSALDLANPDYNKSSSMIVEYDGYTSKTFNSSTDGNTREVVYTDPVNTTYKGLLFATDVPSGGFEVNTTYSTAELNGSVVMYDEETGEEVSFTKGNFTITHMYDEDGTEVTSTSWDDPNYDTYDSTAFIEYMEETKELREQIIESTQDSSSGGSLFGGFGWGGLGGGGITGLAIIGGVLLIVLGIATNRIPIIGSN